MSTTSASAATASREDRILNDLKRGDSVPHEERLTLADLKTLITENYELRENASKDTMLSTWKHLDAFFGSKCKVTRIGPCT